jgi:UDP-N-acetylglucosamine--N-acetylmuramyl-(pentapeptide) pyrophosphoryl-undecaprenol N-acetylglucosamine transferase
MHGIPYIVQEQNSFPGLTTRFFARHARQVHLGFPEAALLLKPGKATRVMDTGNPIDPPPDSRPNRAAARARWNFPVDDRPVMLIYGGSQGSKAINDVVAEWLRTRKTDALHIIWSTGQKTYDDYAALATHNVRITPYLSPVADAYAAADFALSRGGAMATAELCAWGIPPIVVPLPTAAADHQTANARALSAAGAGEFIPQSALTVETLDTAVKRLVENPPMLEERARVVLARARPEAAATIAREILLLAASKSS